MSVTYQLQFYLPDASNITNALDAYDGQTKVSINEELKTVSVGEMSTNYANMDVNDTYIYIYFNDGKKGNPNSLFILVKPQTGGTGFKKTAKRVKLGGRERVVYQGANRKQYIRAKGTFIPLADARKKL